MQDDKWMDDWEQDRDMLRGKLPAIGFAAISLESLGRSSKELHDNLLERLGTAKPGDNLADMEKLIEYLSMRYRRDLPLIMKQIGGLVGEEEG